MGSDDHRRVGEIHRSFDGSSVQRSIRFSVRSGLFSSTTCTSCRQYSSVVTPSVPATSHERASDPPLPAAPRSPALLWVAAGALLAAAGTAGFIWWRRHPEQWQRVFAFVGLWWLPMSLAALALLAVSLVIWRRSRGPEPAGASQTWHGWSTVVSSIATAVTVIVAVIALVADNAAKRDDRQLTQQGQLTDRFSTAIDQMGHSGTGNLTVRLGGIFALERIMKESPPDQPAIVTTLLAFVRDNVPLSKCDDKTPPQDRVGDHPTVDVQAALTVVGNRNMDNDQGQVRLDLRNSCLLGAELQRLHYEGVDLTQSDLTCANLSGVHLSTARLANVFMGQANLRDADLTRTVLEHTLMNDAPMQGATLDGAAFTNGTDLTGAIVTTEQLAKANVASDTIRGDSATVPRLCPA
jgi:hypothetical protein